MQLNQGAGQVVEHIVGNAEELRVTVRRVGDATVVDCGVESAGGLDAGLQLARVCLAGLGDVQLTNGRLAESGSGDHQPGFRDWPMVVVRTDHPVAACMASQYAGWAIEEPGYSAMASGPMRAAAGREELFDRIGHRESPDLAVGVLESGSMPPESVCQKIAERCGVAEDRLTLLVAPTTSLAGALQVVARSVETALHKLIEIGFDITRVESGWGSAPLPPAGRETLTAIGRTNDAILYGAHAVLYARGDDATLAEVGPLAVSASSAEHGRSFREVFAANGNDFYEIDPMLFSPAVVTFVNLDTGQSHRFGHYRPDVLSASFSS